MCACLRMRVQTDRVCPLGGHILHMGMQQRSAGQGASEQRRLRS